MMQDFGNSRVDFENEKCGGKKHFCLYSQKSALTHPKTSHKKNRVLGLFFFAEANRAEYSVHKAGYRLVCSPGLGKGERRFRAQGRRGFPGPVLKLLFEVHEFRVLRTGRK